MASSKFSWGRVLDTLILDFEGRSLEVVKYHPWIYRDGCSTKLVDVAETSYSVQEIRQSFSTLDEAVIAWITFRRLGMNQGPLVAGICKALDIRS